MLNSTYDDKSLGELDAETVQRLPKSFQLMLKIEEQAQAKVNAILEDIKAGKTTLEEIKSERGI